MQFDDDLLIGPVVPGGPSVLHLQAGNNVAGSSPMTKGIGPLGRIFVYDIVPLTLSAAGLRAAAAVAGAGALVLAAGTGVTAVTINGQTRYQFDVPRAVSILSAGDDSGITFTVSGYDIYGQPMTQTLAGSAGAPGTVNTKKAFWQVTGVTASGASAGNVSVGTSNIFGMPVIVSNKGYLARVGWDDTLAENAATVVDADATAAGATTGDVRGTILPAGAAADGVRRLVVGILLPYTAAGPRATRAGALGVTQA